MALDRDTLDRIIADHPLMEDLYPLSPMQLGMLYYSLRDQHGGYYVQQNRFRLETTDVAAAERAWIAAVNRHPVMRTTIAWEQLDTPAQVVERGIPAAVQHLDWRGHSQQEVDRLLADLLEADRADGFDLGSGPLWRLSFIRLGEKTFEVVWTYHHLLLDGWSIGLLINDIKHCIATGGDTSGLREVQPYRNYIAWLMGRDHEAALGYWRAQLSGYDHLTRLELPRPASSISSIAEAEIGTRVASGPLTHAARTSQVTVNSVVLGAWALTLSRLTRTDDVVFGTTTSGRPADLPAVEAIVGCMINTLPVRVKLDDELTASQWLPQLQAEQVRARSHDFLPLSEIQQSVAFEGDDLFDTLFVFENFHRESEGDEVDSGLISLTGHTRINYPLAVVVTPGPDETQISLYYDPERFDRDSVQQICTSFVHILGQLVASPDARLCDLELLVPSQREQVLALGCAPASTSTRTIAQEFELAVGRSPQAIAVSDGTTDLTYVELNEQADQLALELLRRGVGEGSYVGLLLPRSARMVVALLAILKVGGAYVPLNPDYPSARLELMISSVAAKELITDDELANKLHSVDLELEVVNLDSLPQHDKPTAPLPEATGTGESIAYVMFTSGSTGQPKGVAVPNRAVVRLVKENPFADMSSDRVWLHYSSVSFDASTLELWAPLLNGGRCAVLTADRLSVTEMGEAISAYGVDSIWITVSLFNTIIDEGPNVLLPVRQLLCGGEAQSAKHVASALELLPSTTIINGYGPTENTTFTTTYRFPDNFAPTDSVPIGRPINGTNCYVVDTKLRLLPPGVPGELVVGGLGLAAGYVSNDELTSAKFPVAEFPSDERVYRTGDLTRWSADGNLEFLGRLDDQVKIRGFRIEPGEIESVIAQLPGVAQCAVTAVDPGGGFPKRLVAYVVGQALGIDTVREHCARELPDYMVPSSFVALDQMPLNASGKLDKAALPVPSDLASDSQYVAPANPNEEALSAIWAEILGIDRMGVNDNIFQLGGDSIATIRVASRARRAGLDLSVKALFDNPTVGEQARLVTASSESTTSEGEAALVGPVGLSPIIHEFLEWDLPHPSWFNQSILIPLAESIEVRRVHAVLNELVNHHDALRLRLGRQADGWNLHYESPDDGSQLNVCELDVTSVADWRASLASKLEDLQSSFDLAGGPIVAAAIVRTPEGSPRLFLSAHHIAVDAVSWHIITEDLRDLLAADGSLDAVLPPKTTSVRTWTELLGSRADQFADQTEFWREMGEHVTRIGLEDAPRTASVMAQIPPDATTSVLRDVGSAFRTRLDEVVVSVVGSALASLTGDPRVRLEIESHGREHIWDELDLTRTVGWFTAISPVTLALPMDSDSGDALRVAKEALRAIPDRGIGYGVLRYLAPERPLSDLPHGEVVLNNLGSQGSTLLAGFSRRDLPPDSRSTHPLVITSSVIDGRLSIRLTFPDTVGNWGRMEQLRDLLLAGFSRLIAASKLPSARIPTPSDYPLARVSQRDLDQIVSWYAGIEDLYRLSPMQMGMLYHCLKDPRAGYYVVSQVFQVETAEPERIVSGWAAALKRHPIMRTSIAWESLDEPLQVVQSDSEPVIKWLDWRDDDPAEQKERMSRFLAADRTEGFDFAHGPLWRIAMVRVGETTHQMIWSCSQTLLDGWSSSRLVAEATHAIETGDLDALEPVRPFRNYIGWLQDQDADKAAAFWAEYLRDLPETKPLALPVPSNSTTGHAVHYREIDTQLLESIARKSKVTLNTVVQAAWALVLARLGETSEVVFGATTAGRPPELPGAEDIVGCLINTLPVRVKVPEQESVTSWLAGIQSAQSQARVFEATALPEIRRIAGIDSEDPIFETVVVFENYHQAQRTSITSAKITAGSGSERTNFLVSLAVIPHPDRLVLRFGYDAARIVGEVLEAIAGALVHTLEALAAAPDAPVSDIQITSHSERESLIELGDGGKPARAGSTALELFDQQVSKNPDSIAVISVDGDEFSYSKLGQLADQLAAELHSQGIGRGARVGVLVDRSPAIFSAIFGIMRSGAAYVPIDPASPIKRQGLSLEIANCSALVTTEKIAAQLAGESGNPTGIPKITITEDGRLAGGPSTAGSVGLSIPPPQPNDLAYIMFTSGSTGEPKGVGVRHESLANLCCWMAKEFGISALDRILVKTPYTFDGSIAPELVVSLSCGATAVLTAPSAERDSDELIDVITQHQVTIAKFVPIGLQTLLENPRVKELDTLRAVFTGGEQLSATAVEAFGQLVPQAELHNLYGPTEATVDATFFSVRSGDNETPPIGRPLPGVRCYVVDRDLRLLPHGFPGELAIGGIGVAAGYVGRDDLTAASFVPDPYRAGQRLYLTGDRVRWNYQGSLEYIGRRDEQLKVRGYRIEPSEIRFAMEGHPDITTAFVMTGRTDYSAGFRLVAYFVASRQITTDELRQNLSSQLPAFMIPQIFIQLDEMPVTAHGKVNRRALPRAELTSPLHDSYEPPRNPTDAVLAGIFAAVLGLDRLGIDSDLFVMGGDSILSIKIVSKARQAGFAVSIRDLYNYRTVRELADHVTPLSRSEPVGQKPVTGSVPLTPVQEQFFAWKLPDPGGYVSHILLELDDSRTTTSDVEQALRTTFEYHDAFKLRFLQHEDGSWHQELTDTRDPSELLFFSRIETPALDWETTLGPLLGDVVDVIDFTNGPIVAAALVYRTGIDRPILFLAAHHLVVDSVSWRIVIEDFKLVLNSLAAAFPVSLPPKTSSVRAWAERLNTGASEVAEQLDFWMEMTEDPCPLPGTTDVDEPGPATTMESQLSSAETQRLFELAMRLEVTIQEVLLAFLAQTIGECRGDGKVRVDVQGHGRESLWDELDVTRTVGWFALTYPVTLRLAPAGSPDEIVVATSAQLRHVPNRGLGYGILRNSSLTSEHQRLRDRPASPVAFNYVGRFLDENRIVGISRDASRLEPRSKYRMALTALVTGGQLRLVWSYDANVINKAYLLRMRSDYETKLKERSRTAGSSQLLT